MAGKQKPKIYIVSGGSGASGEQIVNTVLAQFQQSDLKVITIPNLRSTQKIDELVEDAAREGALIVITLVDPALNRYILERAREKNIVCIDLMRDLLDHISQLLNVEPAGHPGLYRKLREDYFERIDAIDYTLAHDDGKNPDGWPHAEIILIGVSRVGKTPLSLYLSVLGWKAANIPIVVDLATPPELFNLDRRRMIALTLHSGQLLSHRRHRMERMGIAGETAYAEPEHIQLEQEHIHGLINKLGITSIDVTDKPIETSADHVIRIITRRFGEKTRQA